MLTLADGRQRVVAMTTKPANPLAVTLTEITAGTRLEDRVLKSDFRLSPVASDTVGDARLSASGNAVTFGASNYEGNLTVFRELDATGKADPTEDVAWDLLNTKGARLWVLVSEGPTADTAFASGDEYDLFEVVLDNPQVPTDRAGYIKRTVPLGVQDAWLAGDGAKVAAGV